MKESNGLKCLFLRGKYGVLTAARPAGGTLLHAAEHKTLSIQKIHLRVREHVICPRLQEKLEAADFVGDIARYRRFGYVHSQGRASAAGDQKYPDTISRRSLLVHNLFELIYRTVSQIYHDPSSNSILT